MNFDTTDKLHEECGIFGMSCPPDEDRDPALAAYNAGTGKVDDWLADASYADGNGGLKKIPYRETRQYVSKVTKAVKTYDRLYGAD